MKIGNSEINLYYNNQAAQEISEITGSGNSVRSLIFDSEDNAYDVLTQHKNVAKLILILANNGIRRTNMLINMGVLSGEIQKEYTAEQFDVLLDASKYGEYLAECLEVMGFASQFSVPDSVKMTEPDIDLEEIEAEKNPSGTQS